jgi:ABC-type sugar transport system permease subunit
MVGTVIYYITFPVVGPVIAIIALLDLPKSWKEFKNNFVLICGGKYV